MLGGVPFLLGRRPRFALRACVGRADGSSYAFLAGTAPGSRSMRRLPVAAGGVTAVPRVVSFFPHRTQNLWLAHLASTARCARSARIAQVEIDRPSRSAAARILFRSSSVTHTRRTRARRCFFDFAAAMKGQSNSKCEKCKPGLDPSPKLAKVWLTRRSRTARTLGRIGFVRIGLDRFVLDR
jgi:hypothetical protein